jgi:TRAP-type uncharacterized transport system substrate-binding protein
MSSLKEEILEQSNALYETVLEEIRRWVQYIRETWPLLLLLLALISVALWFAKPAPPDSVLMGTGSKGGSYEMITAEYVKFFAKNGVRLELTETPGAEENIARLSNPKDPLQAAFVQAGLVTNENSKNLLSLGSIGFEPVWFFYRNDKFNFKNLQTKEFLQQPIAIGEVGSGTHRQALHILELNGYTMNDNFKAIPSNEGVQAFIEGKVSSIFIVDGIESENVQRLLKLPNISIGNFDRAAAYTRLMPYFHEISIPQGALNLQQNFPPTDTKMIAPTTHLLIDKNMHPAIQLLFLQAAQKINGGRTFFSKYGQFPAFMESTVPESTVAKEFYEKGTPFLMNYLPFWLAEFIDRLFILILPLFAFAYPLLKTMPGYRLTRARTRINEVYGSLKFFEEELTSSYDPSKNKTYVETIDQIDLRAKSLRVPKTLSSEYYSLRTNIDFVRNMIVRLNTGREGL